MARPTVQRLDNGQLELMYNFLRMGYQKPNVPALKELCDKLRQAMIQKTAGQRDDDPKEYVSFDDLPTIINCIVIETMALHLSGALDKLEKCEGCVFDKPYDCTTEEAWLSFFIQNTYGENKICGEDK